MQEPIKKSLFSKLALLLIPRHGNDYQPHLIRRYGLLVILLFIIGAQVTYNVSQTGLVLGDKANVSVDALLSEANKEREEAHLGELHTNQKLNQAAQMKADDMFKNQYWGHTSPDGVEPWHWLIEADYGYTKAGENLARNFYTAEAVTSAWMNSVDHRKNILEPDYTEAGFAVKSGLLQGESTTIVVALYGRPVGAGVMTPGSVMSTAQSDSIGILTRIGIGMQSVTPAALGSIIVLMFVMMIAFSAHLFRDYIPVAADHPRHRHNHGAIKMGLMFALIVTMLLLYGGGQI